MQLILTTIPPPHTPAIFFNERSRLLETRKIQYRQQSIIYFLVCEGLSIDDVGLSTDTAFQEVLRGAGFETSDFVLEKFGATVERLVPAAYPRPAPRRKDPSVYFIDDIRSHFSGNATSYLS